jgi:hypothetical protein
LVRPEYCTQHTPKTCEECSLSNYGYDCVNNKIKKPAKETYVRARISQALKDRLAAQLARDGLSESDFLLSRVIAYLEQREQESKEQG